MDIHFAAKIIGYISVFLFSINQLSSIFIDLFSEKVKLIIQRYTSNLFKSLLVGILTTLLLDSSSAVIILTLIFINAGILDLKQGIGIALGANIGTTFQSQFFAFDIMAYSFVLLLIGLCSIFVKRKKTKLVLTGVFYIGLLFFSIYLIEELVAQPNVFTKISSLLKEVKHNHLQIALLGSIATVIIQSSGAMVGLAISLSKQGLLDSTMGIAIMMGAELGTCSNTLIAAIGAKKNAVRLVIFNLIFNIAAITLGLVFFEEFVAFIDFLFQETRVARKIANAHLVFNIMGVIIVLPFVNMYTQIIRKVLGN